MKVKSLKRKVFFTCVHCGKIQLIKGLTLEQLRFGVVTLDKIPCSLCGRFPVPAPVPYRLEIKDNKVT